MCHIFIVGRSLSLFTELLSFHDGPLKDGEREPSLATTHSRNKSHHRHQHRQIQAHHCAKGLEDRQRALKIIAHFPYRYFLLMCNERANECLHVFRKKNGWRNENLFLFAFAEWLRMGRSWKRGMLQLPSNDTTIFMYYAGNLHSLRLGFKTFHRRGVACFEKCKVAKVMASNCNKQINANRTAQSQSDWNA